MTVTANKIRKNALGSKPSYMACGFFQRCTSSWENVNKDKLLQCWFNNYFSYSMPTIQELYAKVECSRKEASVPGSVGPQGEVFFDRQELQAASQSRRINMMGRGTFPSLNSYERFFSPSTGRGFWIQPW
jgi:hypothetical protein